MTANGNGSCAGMFGVSSSDLTSVDGKRTIAVYSYRFAMLATTILEEAVADPSSV